MGQLNKENAFCFLNSALQCHFSYTTEVIYSRLKEIFLHILFINHFLADTFNLFSMYTF